MLVGVAARLLLAVLVVMVMVVSRVLCVAGVCLELSAACAAGDVQQQQLLRTDRIASSRPVSGGIGVCRATRSPESTSGTRSPIGYRPIYRHFQTLVDVHCNLSYIILWQKKLC
jgi:hypothetical protein